MRVLASKGSLTCKHLRRTRPRRHTHCSLASHKQDQSKVIVKNQPKVTRQSLEKSLKINLSHSKVENHSKSYSKLELQEQPQNDLCTSSDVFKSIALLSIALLSLNNAIIYPKNRQNSREKVKYIHICHESRFCTNALCTKECVVYLLRTTSTVSVLQK